MYAILSHVERKTKDLGNELCKGQSVCCETCEEHSRFYSTYGTQTVNHVSSVSDQQIKNR